MLEGGGDCHQGGRVEGIVTSVGGWRGLSPGWDSGGDCHQCGRGLSPVPEGRRDCLQCRRVEGTVSSVGGRRVHPG